MKHSLLILAVLPPLLLAQWLEQTDWSGGPGVTGPDWWFGDTFLESYSLDWSTTPGQLALQLSGTDRLPLVGSFPSGNDAVCSGSLISSLGMIPMGTDWSIEWGDILWTGYEPDTTDVYFRLRTGNTPETMGPWGDPITESGTYLGDLLPDDILLLQYMVTLESDDPYTLPILYDVIIEGWYPGGIEEAASPVVPHTALTTGQNPSTGGVSGSLTVSVQEEVVLVVFDTMGRLKTVIFRGILAAGEHPFRLELASPGVYYLVLESSRGSEMERQVVITR